MRLQNARARPDIPPLDELVAGTRRIALVQARLARLLQPLAAVRVVEPPYEAVPLREALWWHPVHTHDAAHIWLRETAARVGRRMADVDEARVPC